MYLDVIFGISFFIIPFTLARNVSLALVWNILPLSLIIKFEFNNFRVKYCEQKDFSVYYSTEMAPFHFQSFRQPIQVQYIWFRSKIIRVQ